MNTAISKRRTKKNSTSTLKNGNNLRKKKTSSIKTPMPVRPEGETIEQQQSDNKRKRETTMSEPENMQTASEGIQMQEPQTGNKRGRMQEEDVSLSSPLQQQQKVEGSANMSLSPSEDEAQVPGALPPLEEVQDSANMSLSPSEEELGLGVQNSNVSPPPPLSLSPSSVESGAVEAQVPGEGAPLPLKEVQNPEDVSLSSSPSLQQQKLEEMEDSLSPPVEEVGLGVQNPEDVSPPPLLQNSENALSPPSLESGAGAPPQLEVQNSENALSQSADDAQSKLGAPPLPLEPEMSRQEQVMQESIDVKPVVVAEDQKEKDPIRDALIKQLKEIKEQTAQIEKQLDDTAAAAGGGGIKKRKKTYYKRYKSKKSMKRKNKTSRNK